MDDDIKKNLEQLPGWDKATARQRSKEYCRLLLMNGAQKLPSWPEIRKIVGKGSPSDLQKGREDAEALMIDSIGKMLPVDAPEGLAVAFREFWQAAGQEALKQYHGFMAEKEVELEEAVRALSDAETSINQLTRDKEALAAQNVALNMDFDQARAKLAETEGGARQAKLFYEERLSELTKERDDALSSAARNQAEMTQTIKTVEKSADERVKGVEKHSLREIERARAETKRLAEESKKSQSILNRKIEDLEKALKLAQNQTKEANRQLDGLKGETASLKADNKGLQRELARERTLNEKLIVKRRPEKRTVKGSK